jgi:hypothetical protein
LSVSARIAAAWRPAFFAPASPMAKVATGTPPGICTMESRLSMPLSALDSTGTPSTGSAVIDAVIPGRCAAPPAPAMMTFSPRPAAALAYALIRSGVRWADMILLSWGTPRALRISDAGFSVGQSDWLPMMTPTSGSEVGGFGAGMLPKTRLRQANRPPGSAGV